MLVTLRVSRINLDRTAIKRLCMCERCRSWRTGLRRGQLRDVV